MTTQIKFIVDEQLAKDFKQIVIAKHGTLDMRPEGEEAMRDYVMKHQKILHPKPAEKDPLEGWIGAFKSKGKHDVVEDLKKLERGEL